MRLIQFAGPIRSEWYQSLVATGARIVTYMPNNAYLVYSNSKSLNAVGKLLQIPQACNGMVSTQRRFVSILIAGAAKGKAR